MFDPVWLGNYIVPRWEAILILFGGGAVGMAGIVILLAGVIAFWKYAWNN